MLALLSVASEQLKIGTPSNYKNVSTILNSFFTNNNPDSLHKYKEIILELLFVCFKIIISSKDYCPLFDVWRSGLHSLGKLLQPTELLFLDHAKLCANFIADYINDE